MLFALRPRFSLPLLDQWLIVGRFSLSMAAVEDSAG
jgi:hypothetical protein